MSYTITEIRPSDVVSMYQVDILLHQEGIRRDNNLDYICGLYDEDWNLIATGSCFRNTIRCLAVTGSHRGEGLLNDILTHLIEAQMIRGITHLFLYTKPEGVKYMQALGFYEIVRVPGALVFMENRRSGFARYCDTLRLNQPIGQPIAGIVMNANPFTLGHLHLVERAAWENKAVHIFILAEESGLIPFSVRKMLVEQGIRHLKNVTCHTTGPYQISSATFPSYFLKDADAVIRAQAELDLRIFAKIAEVLSIRRRYVGQENSSHVTALYNETMLQKLPGTGIECIEIPRLAQGGTVISAGLVRQAIHDDRADDIKAWVPESTYEFFRSSEGRMICAAIRQEADVIHY
ncbi:MAG: [citrate (pro-3S)-lyase] ligase [Ruminococcaceae bacterium]|nr:[citrate (pro-3S)-lyase] ligase [Oscillospiraceae bacterium]